VDLLNEKTVAQKAGAAAVSFLDTTELSLLKRVLQLEGVGERLRQRRKVKKLSLAAMAKLARLSIGLLSQIERGISSPSVRSVSAICAALDMPVRWLFQDSLKQPASPVDVVVRAENRRRLDLGPSGMIKEILSSDQTPQLQLMRFIVRPSGTSGHSPYLHQTGAKAGVVISGLLGLEVDGRQYKLRRGDSFSFEGTSNYRFWSLGKQDCELFWAVTPAIY
jgi:transcriptional regulator with XRE-family HTH domain